MTAKTSKIGLTISQLLKHSNISASKLGQALNIPRSTISSIVSGKTTDPRSSTLEAIAGYFKVTVDQLLGNEPIYKDNMEPAVKTDRTTIPLVELNNAKHWEAVIKHKISDIDTDSFPVDPTTEDGKLAVRVTGEAMWPIFQENTTLIIDPDKHPKNKDFVIVHIKEKNETLLRQLIIEGNYRFVKAINSLFPAIQLEKTDHIVGVVTKTIHIYD